MTEWDVREYLTKIYDLPVRDVKMKAEQGKIYFTLPDYRAGVAREKEHDQMYAYVTLKRDIEFKFPNGVLVLFRVGLLFFFSLRQRYERIIGDNASTPR